MKTWTDITRATNAQILDWAEAQPWARDMAACQQDAQWHAEGDVWTHTKMVCAELERLADWPSLDRAAQLKLLFTALFHDSGKPATTALDPETGRTRSPKHALVGAEIARRVLRESGVRPRHAGGNRGAGALSRTPAVSAGESQARNTKSFRFRGW